MTETNSEANIFLVGLTGGIASGKTAASDHFQFLGVPVVDADLVAREVVNPGTPALIELTTIFGKQIINDTGELNRAELRTIVFNSSEQREKLEGVLHPAIRQRSSELIRQHRDEGATYVVYAVPLLVETMQANRFDRIAVVDVATETQILRLQKRDKISLIDAEKIIVSQASRAQRLANADDIIDNEGTLDELKERVAQLHGDYLKLAMAGGE